MKVLLVDDEPYTVDGLYEMLTEHNELDLNIYCAYSAEEATQRMLRTKMDIVISDMRMPGMNGLELQAWIRERWPKCQIIFLTGIRDLDFAQQAIRGGGSDYILKMEGDEAIVQSLKRAIAVLQENSDSEQFLQKAKHQVLHALPVLRKEWFLSMLDQREFHFQVSDRRFAELGVVLSNENKVLLLVGRIDGWNEDFTSMDKALLLYAIQNIAEEHLQRSVFLPIILEGPEFVWLIQSENTEADASQEELIPYVLGTLESIQVTCRELLRLSISLATMGRLELWGDIPNSYRNLKQQLLLGFGNGKEMLLTYEGQEHKHNNSQELGRHLISDLERELDAGSTSEFETKLELFIAQGMTYSEYAYRYYCVALILLERLHRLNYGHEGANSMDTERLMNVAFHESKLAAQQFLVESARVIWGLKKQTTDDRTKRLIQDLHDYIQLHLTEDLSLDTLADKVFLNASYLSSLYKQVTGRNISDYITGLRLDLARDLLAQPHMKVHEIAEACGYSMAGYFTRLFKKHHGMTPQEYRLILPNKRQ
ncbi:response regulator [Paenibacillus sp. LMG 31461]|uniref:Response regulator n=1 Tax=Paenibacillus plantarum TaxID=2654975 RepID=A0ABX1X3K6_9BACL|nr:response regulator [Paenibacillus plantarum]NOU62826.1 response regulator [Paenibacillus plantarum]